jgi:hypothetical protein
MTYTNTQADPVANPYLQAPPPPPVPYPPTAVRTSPGLAFLLGLIPGVGAIYNGQYLKGLLHVAVFGLLVSAADRSGGSPLMGMLSGAFFFYMPFEAYHTAKKRQMGVPVDEWSSILPNSAFSGRFPIGPILLIILGVVFLLDELNVFRFYDMIRFWPVGLIALGAYLLYGRVKGSQHPGPAPYLPAAPHAPAPSTHFGSTEGTPVEVQREQ